MLCTLLVAALLACSSPPQEAPKQTRSPKIAQPAQPSISELRQQTLGATAADGTPRDWSDLRGQKTVLWFYPAAATGG